MTARRNGIGTPGPTIACELHDLPDCKLCKRPKPKKAGRRHITQKDYLRMIGAAKARQNGQCAGHLAGINHECQEPFDFAHIIDQQTLVKKFGEGHESLTDDRLGIYACRKIHGDFDKWGGELSQVDIRADLVAVADSLGTFEAAKHYGLEIELERKIIGAAALTPTEGER